MDQELTSSLLYQRLLTEGASKLSNSELMAVLLETTPPSQEMRTLDLTYQLLNYEGELRQFLGVVSDWLYYTQDIFEADEALLKASIEVQKRALTKVLTNSNPII
jgi:DNA repair protein RadC